MGVINPPFNPANSVPFVKNWDPTKLKKWRAALAKVRSGSGEAIINVVGDSRTAGSSALSAGSYAGARPYSWPVQLSTALSARGLSAHADNAFGNQNVNAAGQTVPQYDARFTLGTGWVTTAPSGHWATGPGNTWTNVTDTTSVLSFAPTGSFDTIDVYYVTGGAFGSFTVNVDGGASLGTIATSGSNGVGKTTFTCAAGAHTINLQVSSLGNGVFVYGVETRLSTSPKVSVRNFGYGGAGVVWWSTASNPWAGSEPAAVLGGDLTLIDLSINDAAVLGTTVAAYNTGLDYIVGKWSAVGDVVLIKGVAGNNTGSYPNADGPVLTTYQNVIDVIAAKYNCPVVDWRSRWQSYAVSNALGYYGDTGLHPSKIGYADHADHMASLLARI